MMAMVMHCLVCGAPIPVPTCPSCGAELAPGEEAPIGDRPVDDADRQSAHGGQTWSEYEQTLSDQDQTWSDQDQTASERDQRDSDDDQRAADEDLAAGGDPLVHRRSVLSRARARRERGATSNQREETADGRLTTAAERDRIAALRDQSAEARDAAAQRQDLEDKAYGGPEDTASRAERNRERAAADRSQAAADRVRAAADRAAAAADRAEALQRRDEAARALKLASTDDLTHTWARKPGLAQVARELERAQRAGNTLVLAFVDVDDLKKVNDSQGHAAGDAMLRLVGRMLRTHVRSHDVVVRYGGDEFVCAMPHVGLTDAKARLEQVAEAIASAATGCSITFGLAAADPSDNFQTVMDRADASLLEAKRFKKHAGTA
jgi:diguanylate cyclase (GGDEF)-like protein